MHVKVVNEYKCVIMKEKNHSGMTKPCTKSSFGHTHTHTQIYGLMYREIHADGEHRAGLVALHQK